MIYLIWVTSGAFCLFLALIARGVTFAAPNVSDAEQQVLAAADAENWRWPADILRSCGKSSSDNSTSIYG